MSELEKIPGTGEGGRLTKKDLLSYLAGGRVLGYTNLEPVTHTTASTSTNTESAQTSSEPAMMIQSSKPSADDSPASMHGVVTSGSVS